MFPALVGQPIQVRIQRSLGPHLAASCVPLRLILMDSEVLLRRGEFERILTHEIFHFVWVRLSNQRRGAWERILAQEMIQGATGELGWSAEWRKGNLTSAAPGRRSPAWRRYACESFCDTAAWRFAGLRRHEEFTLPARFRRPRQAWFEREIESRHLPV